MIRVSRASATTQQQASQQNRYAARPGHPAHVTPRYSLMRDGNGPTRSPWRGRGRKATSTPDGVCSTVAVRPLPVVWNLVLSPRVCELQHVIYGVANVRRKRSLARDWCHKLRIADMRRDRPDVQRAVARSACDDDLLPVAALYVPECMRHVASRTCGPVFQLSEARVLATTPSR